MKTLLPYAALAISVILAGSAAAQPAMVQGRELDAREHHIARALRRNVHNHVLTDDQFRRCMEALDRIKSEEANMRAQNGGLLTIDQFQGLNVRVSEVNQWSSGAAMSDLPR